MKNKLIIIFTLFFLTGIETFSNVIEQDSDSTGTSNKDSIKASVSKIYTDTTYLPSRGKLVFTSITGVDDPFVSTKFSLGFGIAEMTDTEIPITIGDYSKTIVFEPDLFYSTAVADFQYAVRDWAAVYVKYSGLARLGNNFLSLASEGVSAAGVFKIGWLFRVAENEDIMFSGAISMMRTNLTFINLLAEKDTTITPVDTLVSREIITNYESLTSEIDLRLAIRFSNVFGMLTSITSGFGSVYAEGSQSSIQYVFGLALSIDLRNWISIPFGVGIGGSILSNEWRFKDAKPPVYSANINIAFYNRNDFTIGVENFLQVIQPRDFDYTLDFLYTRIYMSYYF